MCLSSRFARDLLTEGPLVVDPGSTIGLLVVVSLPCMSLDIKDLDLGVCPAGFDAPGMGNSSSDRSSGGQGERSFRDGQQGGKEARPNILIDSTEDGDLFQREDAKV